MHGCHDGTYLKDGLLDELCVDGSDAIDVVAGDDGQVAHADHFAAVLVSDNGQGGCKQLHGMSEMAVRAVSSTWQQGGKRRELTHAGGVIAELALDLVEEAPVDVVDDLHVAGQELLHHLDVPGLDGLRHHRVVGKGEDLRRDLPGLCPAQAVLVHQQAHQLWHRDDRVRVVKLELRLPRELVPVAVPLQETPDDVLEGRGREEVLLAEAKLLALVGAVVRVENGRNGLRALPAQDGLNIVARVEGLQVEASDWLGGPEAEVDRVGRVVAWDGVVVRHRHHLLLRVPLPDLPPVLFKDAHVPVELDRIGDCASNHESRAAGGSSQLTVLLRLVAQLPVTRGEACQRWGSYLEVSPVSL